MQSHAKFELCLEIARRFVAARRAEAPEGCDPQNTYAAIASAVIGAGTAVYGGMQAKKAQKKQSSMSSISGGMPSFQPFDFGELQDAAVDADQEFYALSDDDYKKRHPGMLTAEGMFEDQIVKDWQGEHELMPQIQNEFMRSGISGALSAFGGTPGTLAPGSAGEATVARNLGLSVMGFQDRNRAIRMNSLLTGEQVFPRRTFGLTGENAAQILMQNTQGANNQAQAQFALETQEGQQASAQASADAAAQQQMYASIASSLASSIGSIGSNSRSYDQYGVPVRRAVRA